jgi:hypothetical protein
MPPPLGGKKRKRLGRKGEWGESRQERLEMGRVCRKEKESEPAGAKRKEDEAEADQMGERNGPRGSMRPLG